MIDKSRILCDLVPKTNTEEVPNEQVPTSTDVKSTDCQNFYYGRLYGCATPLRKLEF